MSKVRVTGLLDHRALKRVRSPQKYLRRQIIRKWWKEGIQITEERGKVIFTFKVSLFPLWI